MTLVVRAVTGADTTALRITVLRDGRADALLGDDEAALHLGVYDGEQLVGTGNVRRDKAAWLPADAVAWRLRGMATDESFRGRGVGALVLDSLVEHCRNEGGTVLWCHARVPAQRFYERAGFVAFAEPWVDPEIGPHVRMQMALAHVADCIEDRVSGTDGHVQRAPFADSGVARACATRTGS